MAGKAPIDAVNAIHDALENLDKESQLRALQAAVLLLGLSVESIGLSVEKSIAHRDRDNQVSTNADAYRIQSGSPSEADSATDYFKSKDPQGLMEVLAVAARFRELHERAESHTKGELDAVFRKARRNAPTNFPRDLRNAKQHQYFNRGSNIVLSHYGQTYVDALPDRQSAKAIARPKNLGGSKKKKTKVDG